MSTETQKKAMPTSQKFAIGCALFAFAFIAFTIILAISSVSDVKKLITTKSPSTTVKKDEQSVEDKERDIIKDKLKAKAAKTWPNDYTTQEFWIDENLEAYDFMRTIPEDDPIKKKAMRDWPLDFSTQKFWYNEQIEAKSRLNE
jgi:uncharacterized membrane protein YhiD involved in acid resistance